MGLLYRSDFVLLQRNQRIVPVCAYFLMYCWTRSIASQVTVGRCINSYCCHGVAPSSACCFCSYILFFLPRREVRDGVGSVVLRNGRRVYTQPHRSKGPDNTSYSLCACSPLVLMHGYTLLATYGFVGPPDCLVETKTAPD
jgi:hypothetical protein